MRFLLALVPVLLLAACLPEGEGQPRLHEVVLYGAENVRLSYFYGEPGTLQLGDRSVALERSTGVGEDPLVLPEALSIDGRAFLRERVPALAEQPATVSRIPATSDLRVELAADTGPVLYFDGRMWFTLLRDGRAGMDTRVVPTPRVGALRGLGELNRVEADALARYIEAGGPAAVTLLDEVPAVRRSVAGVSEYLRTGLYVQREFPTAPAATRPVPRTVQWETIASGQNASGVEREAFHLVADEAEFRSLWNTAHGSRIDVPPLPPVDFARERVVVVFLGTRPTGGHSVEVADMSLQGSDLYVDLTIEEPAADAITTQALTSPWTVARVLRGGIDVAWFRRAGSDRFIGVARTD